MKFAENVEYQHNDDGTIEFIIDQFFEEMKTPNLRNFVSMRLNELIKQVYGSSSSSDSDNELDGYCKHSSSSQHSSNSEEEDD